MTTTNTQGAGDLPEAGCSKHHLIHCSQCRHDNMVRDLRAENDRLTTQLAALAAGQATAAQQGVAYAALPDERAAFEAWYCDQMRTACYNANDGIAHLRKGNHYGEHRVLLNGKWEAWKARASHGQASAGAEQ